MNLYLGLADFREIAHKFLSKLLQQMFSVNVSALFLRVSGSSQKFMPKFNPKMGGGHPSPISPFLEPFFCHANCPRSGEGVVRRNGRPKVFFWRVRFFSSPLRFALKRLKTLREQRRNGLSKNTLLDNHFSARRLLCSFGAPPETNTLRICESP